MTMKSWLADIVDGRLVFAAEALEILPTAGQLRVVTDSERGTVCIYAKDRMALSPQTEA